MFAVDVNKGTLGKSFEFFSLNSNQIMGMSYCSHITTIIIVGRFVLEWVIRLGEIRY